ncbi:MAG: hypothetical protein HQK81_06245 [Desulfovibrionaceae bacterium]|nr:hypothetical protein [Desulfovibrionaceae bacterium]MBF0513650.1 hypothetical protein [Desulfovibrionaceae bacterium]
MAKAIITIEDKDLERAKISCSFKFMPTLQKDSQQTPALELTCKIMSFIADEIKRERFDDIQD